MPRQIDPSTLSAMQSKVVIPAILIDLAINGQTLHIWSGVGNFGANGVTYTGVGDLGQVTAAHEGIDVTAEGATLCLSGVDLSLVNDALTDIQLGAPCTMSIGFLTATGSLIGSPIVVFRGLVDAPSVQLGIEKAVITVPVESRLAVLAHGQQRKYTRADQHLHYPDDTGFNYVEALNDLAIRWGH